MTLTLADITVKRFMAAMFNGDYEGIPNWPELFTAYIDLSGMAESRQRDLMAGIHNLETRLRAIDSFCAVQTKFFEITGRPLTSYTKQFCTIDDIEGVPVDLYTETITPFDAVKRFGHRITWDAAHPELFLPQLARMTAREKRNVAELDRLNKELADLSKTRAIKEDKNARQEFVRMLNNIGKAQGYAINRDDTDMETLCLMLKQNQEEAEAFADKKH